MDDDTRRAFLVRYAAMAVTAAAAATPLAASALDNGSPAQPQPPEVVLPQRPNIAVYGPPPPPRILTPPEDGGRIHALYGPPPVDRMDLPTRPHPPGQIVPAPPKQGN